MKNESLASFWNNHDHLSVADPAFLIRGGPNLEIFVLDLRKLFQRF